MRLNVSFLHLFSTQRVRTAPSEQPCPSHSVASGETSHRDQHERSGESGGEKQGNEERRMSECLFPLFCSGSLVTRKYSIEIHRLKPPSLFSPVEVTKIGALVLI